MIWWRYGLGGCRWRWLFLSWWMVCGLFWELDDSEWLCLEEEAQTMRGRVRSDHVSIVETILTPFLLCLLASSTWVSGPCCAVGV